jgi:hypothetical protein
MSERADEGSSPRSSGSASRRGGNAGSERSTKGKPPHAARECVDCEVQEGVPRVRGKARAHYRTGQAGQRMLVLDRRPGERIRINATTEIVILEIGPDTVRIAVEAASEAAP